MHKRIGLIAGGAAVALAAVAGCSTSSANGGSSGNGGTTLNLTPVAEIQAALTKASNDKTVHVTGTISFGGSDGTMTADEQFGNNVELSMNLTAQGANISEILIDNKLYAKIPQLTAELGGKSWVLFDLNALGSLGSTFQSLVNSAKNLDPSQQLQPLLASGDLHKVGTETVDGVQADHYNGTVDAATAFDSSQAAKNLTADQIAQLKALMKAGGVTTETIDLWVQSNGLPVRIEVSSNTSQGAFKVDMHLSNWGAPVTITAPPADQVGDISSLLGGLLGATPSSS